MRRAFAIEAVLPWLPGSLEYLSSEVFGPADLEPLVRGGYNAGFCL
jgi:hypothetical protein